MRSKLRALAAVVAVALATISIQGLSPATAATEVFGHVTFAGGTKITAVGTTITSDLTAASSVKGTQPDAESNKVASVRVGSLARVGAIETDATAVRSGIGFKTTAHANTANVSLLNGAIRVSAVDTVSNVEANGEAEPTASSTTEFVGLTIAGKKYPINVPANTGVIIPGLAQVTINYSQTSIDGDSVITQGAGLYVTLLRATGGVAAGATIVLNPTYSLVTPVKDTDGGKILGGGGTGAYAFAHVGDEIQAQTGRVGAKTMPPMGTNGETTSNSTAHVNLPQLLTAKTVESTTTGTSIPALSEATATSTVANLRLFPSLFSSLISATAIGSTAHVRLDGGTPITEGNLQFINLKVAGKAIPVNVAPNTTIDVAGLGKVVINEHKELRVPGAAHAYQVTALHITLDTEKAGLPIGAEVQIGTSLAIVYG
jgi:hypothetical protein